MCMTRGPIDSDSCTTQLEPNDSRLIKLVVVANFPCEQIATVWTIGYFATISVLF